MLASGWQDLIGTTVAQRYLLRNLVSASSLQAEFTGVSNDENSTPVSVALIEVEAGEAESELARRHKDWRKRKQLLDAASAAIILQDYLDERARQTARVEGENV
jgi:RNase H-fold protein (predicted Holliday junction resolvase)